MGWFGPAGNCGCCDEACEPCAEITYFTIDIADPVCTGTATPDPGFCSRNNGTYVFRTVGSPTGDGCAWIVSPLASGICEDAIGFGYYYIGYVAMSGGGCGAGTMAAVISFANDPGGGVIITVSLQYSYNYINDFASPAVRNSSVYYFTFSDTFATCADAVGATLPLTDTNISLCQGSDPGDFCDVASAVVTIG